MTSESKSGFYLRISILLFDEKFPNNSFEKWYNLICNVPNENSTAFYYSLCVFSSDFNKA